MLADESGVIRHLGDFARSELGEQIEKFGELRAARLVGERVVPLGGDPLPDEHLQPRRLR